MSHDDLEIEPIPGLPGRPPEGERILWQGSPRWPALTRRLFKIRQITVYFAILVAWAVITSLYDGRGVAAAAIQGAWLSALGAAGIGLLALYAWLIARTTIYTITNRRIVFRAGVALPLSVNIPFKQVAAVRLTTHGDGTGNLALALRPNARIGYAYMWPHARPWHFARTEPMLRCIPDPEATATVLRDALAAFDAGREDDAPAAAGRAGAAPEGGASTGGRPTEGGPATDTNPDTEAGGTARAAAAAR